MGHFAQFQAEYFEESNTNLAEICNRLQHPRVAYSGNNRRAGKFNQVAKSELFTSCRKLL